MILWEIIHRPNTNLNPSNCGLFIREAGGGVYVAKVHRRNGTDEAPDEKAFANARLMAEAPAMRAVIERFVASAKRLRLNDSALEVVSDAKVILMMIDGRSTIRGLTMAELESDMRKHAAASLGRHVGPSHERIDDAMRNVGCLINTNNGQCAKTESALLQIMEVLNDARFNADH